MTQRHDDHGRKRPSERAKTPRSLLGSEANAASRPSASPETTLAADLDSARTLRERLALFVDSSPLAFVAWDERGRAAHWSARAAELFGWSQSDVIGRTPGQLGLVHDADLVSMEAELARLARAEVRRTSVQLRARRKHGAVFYSRWYFSGLYDEAGCLLSLFSQIDDISAQHAIEERYQTLFQQSKDAIFLMNGSAFVDCNESTLAMFGCEYHDIIGRAPYCFSPPAQRDGCDSKLAALDLMRTAYAGQPQRFEWLHCRLDGSLFDAEVSLNRLQLSEGTMLLAIVRDITERRARELERQRYQDDLRDFAARLAHAGDLERRRLAADLHDSAGQNLSAALLRLRQAHAHATQPSQLQQLQIAQELIERTSDQLRSMSLQLAPPVLHEVGLRAALDGAARQFEEEWGVACQVLGEEPLDPLPLEVRTTLYRCICELLANVAKHAHASRVTLTWQGCDGATTLRVTDDGCGFDEASARGGSRAPGGFGLFSIRERMRSIGGCVEVGSTLGKGTTVALGWTAQDRP